MKLIQIPKDVGQRFRQYRINRGLYQIEVAKILSISDQSVGAFELGLWLHKKNANILLKLERKWAFEECRKAMTGIEYDLKGTHPFRNYQQHWNNLLEKHL